MVSLDGRHFKRNFILGVATGAFVNLGMAFLDPVTVLPVFVAKLGGSSVLIGLVSALHGVGWFLPQIFASRLAETRRRLIYMYRAAAVARIVCLVGAAYAVFRITAENMHLALGAFVVLLFTAHLLGGVSAIPFLEITSKTIPVTSLGRFFGTRRLIGGALAVGAGMIVALVLKEQPRGKWMPGPWFDLLQKAADRIGLTGHAFPADFGVIFLMGALFMAIGVLAFWFAGEDPATQVAPSTGFVTHLKSGFSLLRLDADYRRFYAVRICWQFTAMAFPFYVGFAYDRMGLPENLVGLFLSIWVGAGLFSNTVWGRLMDRRGNKIVLLITAIISVFPPLTILVLDATTARGTPPGAFALALVCSTFLLNGMVRSGRIISNITYLLEFAPEGRRPLYVGFMNSFSFPFMLTPLLAGVIIQATNMKTLFALCLLFAALGVILSAKLREPRPHES